MSLNKPDNSLFLFFFFLEQAISNLKANAAQQNQAKPVTDTKLPKPKPEYSSESHSKMPNQSQEGPKFPSSSVLPPDFFDNNDPRKPKSGEI